jgi:hypothetical protein
MNSSATEYKIVDESILESNIPNFLTSDDIFGKPIPQDAYLGLPHSILRFSDPYDYKQEEDGTYVFEMDLYYFDSSSLGNYLVEGINHICAGGGYDSVYRGRCVWELYGLPNMGNTLTSYFISYSYTKLYKITIENRGEKKGNTQYCIKVIRTGVENDEFNMYKYIRRHLFREQR